MALIIEGIIDAHFKATAESDDIQQEWNKISAALYLPEVIKQKFTNEAVKLNAFLTVYGLLISELNKLSDVKLEWDWITQMVQWCTNCMY